MLVYRTGQFFLPHQDSERSDAMVGTLVVTLPSSFKGGAFVIEHMGKKVRYLASKRPLTFIAFYADCTHEVRPVTQGYRIVLTYNLTPAGRRHVAVEFDFGFGFDFDTARTLARAFHVAARPRWRTVLYSLFSASMGSTALARRAGM